jgi:hypothetical protein
MALTPLNNSQIPDHAILDTFNKQTGSINGSLYAAQAKVTTGGSYFIVAPSTGTNWFDCRYKVSKRTDVSPTVYGSLSGTSGKVYDETTSGDVTATTSAAAQNSFRVTWSGTVARTYSMHFVADADI